MTRLLGLVAVATVFAGCNAISEIKFQSPPTSTPATDGSTSNASGFSLSGTYIAQAYAPGCAPASLSDFMETVSWSVRRVEPRDCALVRLATPVFSWPLPSGMNSSVPMNLVITRDDGFRLTVPTTTPRVLLPNALSSGSYQWRVTYTNQSGAVASSQTRRFTVVGGNLFAIPTGAALSQIVAAKSHPRALPAGSDFSTIAARAQSGEFKIQYTAFLTQASTYASGSPSPVPANLTRADFNSDLEYNNWMIALKKQAENEANAIMTLGYAARFASNASYESAGIARLVSLAAWPPNGATSDAVQDQANRQIYLALAVGLDAFYSKLSASDRAAIVASLKNRLSQAMSDFSAFDTYPYYSHLVTAALFSTETLMHVAGMPEFPEASSLLSKAWETMVTMLGVWGGMYDAGYANGDSYGWYSMTDYARIAAVTKLIANVDLTRIPAVGRFLDNQIALTPPAAELRGQFGDEVELTSHYFDFTWDSARLFAGLTGRAEDEWYWRAYPRNLTLAASGLPYQYLLLGSSWTPPSVPAGGPELPDSWLFEDVGIVAMHSKTTDSQRSSVFFRSSRFGAFNHAHADNNAFTFVSRGKELLISGGYYPYYNSPHHALVGRATRFKNALTFDGGIGQAEPSPNPTAPGAPVFSMDARGRLINFADNGTWAITTGDATLAYRGQNTATLAWTPLLSGAVRTVAYQRHEGVVVIYDWATSASARKWELNFQSLNAPTLSGKTVRVFNAASSACIDVYGPSMSVSITNGFPIAPEVTKPDQYHTRYSVSSPSNELVSVTVIREDCRAVPVSVSFSQTSARISVNGSALTFNQRTVQGL